MKFKVVSTAFSINCSADTTLAGGDIELDLDGFNMLFRLLGVPSMFSSEDPAELSDTYNLCKSTCTSRSIGSLRSLDFCEKWKLDKILVFQIMRTYTTYGRIFIRWPFQCWRFEGTSSQQSSCVSLIWNNSWNLECFHCVLWHANCCNEKNYLITFT